MSALAPRTNYDSPDDGSRRPRGPRRPPNIASDSWRGDRDSVRAIFAVFYPSGMRGSSYVIESPRARGRERFRATEITEARLESVERSTTDTRDSSRNGRVPSSRPFQQNILYFQGRPTVSLARSLALSLSLSLSLSLILSFFRFLDFLLNFIFTSTRRSGSSKTLWSLGCFCFTQGTKIGEGTSGEGKKGAHYTLRTVAEFVSGRFHCFPLRDAPNSRGFALQR